MGVRPIYSSDSRKIDEATGAQEAYGPLKTAINIIGMLNTAIDEPAAVHKKDTIQPSNPFDNERFYESIREQVAEFSKMTDSNAIAAGRILELMDYDLTHYRYAEARKKVTDLSIYFMEMTKNHLKRKYPW